MAIRPEDRPEIGKRLRCLRKAFGVDQVVMSERVGVKFNTWNNWERGSSSIPIDKAAILVQKHRITLDWIYLGVEAGMPYELLMKVRDRAESGCDEQALGPTLKVSMKRAPAGKTRGPKPD